MFDSSDCNAHLGLVHTMPDKFENATLRVKTEQMFLRPLMKTDKMFWVHTIAFLEWLFTFNSWQF